MPTGLDVCVCAHLPLLSMEAPISGSCDTDNSTISNQLVAGSHGDAHQVNLCLVLGLECVWSYEVHMECLSRFDDSKLCWQFVASVLSTLVCLATVHFLTCDWTVILRPFQYIVIQRVSLRYMFLGAAGSGGIKLLHDVVGFLE